MQNFFAQLLYIKLKGDKDKESKDKAKPPRRNGKTH